jgi:hypothetical protein
MMILVTFLLLVILAISTGYVLLNWSLKWAGAASLPLRLGAAYFIGMAFNIVLVRTLSTLLKQPDLSVWLTVLMSICLCLINFRQLKLLAYEAFTSIASSYVVLLAMLFAPLILLFWLPVEKNPDWAFATIGSLHSARYAWIANYISFCGYVPILGQNTGQSILTFMMMVLSENRPYIFLFTWLYSSIVFLAVYIYGVISLYEKRTRLILLAILIMLLGNSAFSLTHVLVIDSGSPFALSGYTDSLFGVFSILMLLFYFAQLKKTATSLMPVFFVVGLICSANFFTAPQNMLFLLAIIPVLVINSYISNISLKSAAFWISVLLVSALIAIPQGGMLTPKYLQSPLDFIGLMSTQGLNAKHTGFEIIPGIPFHFGWTGGEWKSGQMTFLKEAQGYMANWRAEAVSIIWILEQVFFTSIRVLFFPILGIVALYYLSRREMASPSLEQNIVAIPSVKTLLFLGAYVMLIGFIICFTVMVNGFKWEFSRFLIPGVTIGMLGFSLYVLMLLKSEFKANRLWIYMGIFIIVCGSVLDLFGTSLKNGIELFGKVEHKGSKYFLGVGPIIEQSHCR